MPRNLPIAWLCEKLPIGTVSESHLQILSDPAFDLVAGEANGTFEKRTVNSALTMDEDFYSNKMAIQRRPLRLTGRALHAVGRLSLRNEVFCVPSDPASEPRGSIPGSGTHPVGL